MQKASWSWASSDLARHLVYRSTKDCHIDTTVNTDNSTYTITCGEDKYIAQVTLKTNPHANDASRGGRKETAEAKDAASEELKTKTYI
jgi:hypothetical protein